MNENDEKVTVGHQDAKVIAVDEEIGHGLAFISGSCNYQDDEAHQLREKTFCSKKISNYRVCPSLMFTDEDIKPQNFWASSKSHVATTYLCMHLCSNYIG